MTEKQLENDGPILVDIDLRYDYKIDKRQHTSDDILKMICLYVNELETMFQFDEGILIPIYIFFIFT